MFRSLVLAALLAVPGIANAQQDAGALLDEARAKVSTMKRSASKVRQLSSHVPAGDQVSADCVTDSTESIQKSVSHAEATIQAAAGWGPDVAAAVLKSVGEAQQEVKEKRSQAYKCVGLDEEEALADESADGEEGDAEEAVAEAEGAASDSFDPFSPDAASSAGTVTLSNRAPAASPTK